MEFIIESKKQEAEGVVSLYIKKVDGQKLDFKAGQYLVVKPLGSDLKSKAFTISSAPSESLVCLTIKVKSGTSLAITNLNIGDKVAVNGPFGHFYPENNLEELVMLAGGIGVTPFYSVIKDRLENITPGKITLFYSNKNMPQTALFKELNKLSVDNDNFRVIYTFTQEKPTVDNFEFGRINIKFLKKYLSKLNNKKYYLCGSIQFTNDMWKILKDASVEESSIFTEAMY
ncbi:MAG: FAD-dependent oxidoreductase [bacterium]